MNTITQVGRGEIIILSKSSASGYAGSWAQYRLRTCGVIHMIDISAFPGVGAGYIDGNIKMLLWEEEKDKNRRSTVYSSFFTSL